jgi:hypothetical protein
MVAGAGRAQLLYVVPVLRPNAGASCSTVAHGASAYAKAMADKMADEGSLTIESDG